MKKIIYAAFISAITSNTVIAMSSTFSNMQIAVSATYGEFGLEEPSEDYWKKGCENEYFCFIQNEKFMIYANSNKIVITPKGNTPDELENSCLVAYENMSGLPQSVSASAIISAFNENKIGTPYAKEGYSIVAQHVSVTIPYIECTIEAQK